MSEATAIDPQTTLYCTFTAAGHWFGVPAQLVREVHALTPITPIPGAPRAVLGYANLRGQLYLVLKAQGLLMGVDSSETGDAHLILFKPAAGEFFAIQTGAVGEIVTVRRDQVDVPKAKLEDASPEVQTYDRSACVIGHAKLDHALLTLVDPALLLAAAFEEAGLS